MLNKTCFIVEDNKEDLEILLSYIERTSFLKVMGIACNYTEAVKFLLTHDVDLLFSSIHLEAADGFNGFDILKTIPNAPKTIITSKFVESAVEAFNLGTPIDFLLKPYDFKRFLIALNRALSSSKTPSISETKDKHVFFKMGRKFQKFNITEILFLEAYGLYLKVYLDINKKPYVINETISSITEHLDKNVFVRIHKSYMVNIDKITSFDGNHIYIDSFPITIGASYKPKTDKILKQFINND